jgi:hypothetical protein
MLKEHLKTGNKYVRPFFNCSVIWMSGIWTFTANVRQPQKPPTRFIVYLLKDIEHEFLQKLRLALFLKPREDTARQLGKVVHAHVVIE